MSFLTPLSWQLEALQAWKDNNFHGTVKGATGTGKTFVGEMAISQEPDNVLIVVHTEHLQTQWKDWLEEHFGLGSQIGFVGAGKEEWDKRIVIAIVNSIRYNKLVDKKFALLVADEFHHYGSSVNRTFLAAGNFKKILGLSATPERDDGAHLVLFEVAPIVYEYGHEEAINSNILCPVEVVNVGVNLNPEEKFKIIEAEKIISRLFPYYGHDFKLVQAKLSMGDMLAGDLLKAFNFRKQILWHAQEKIIRTTDIVLKEQGRVIIFSEFVETANALYETLTLAGCKAVSYHSGIGTKERREILEKFRKGEFRVLISVRCLDEGIDVPDVEVGIIVAGSSVRRQIIQRLGRVLRNRPGKVAKLYQLYVRDSQDMKWLKKRNEVLTEVTSSFRWE